LGYIGTRSLAFGAAALLLIGLLSWNLLLQGLVENLQGEVRNAQGQVNDLQAQVRDDQDQQTQTIALGGTWADQGADAEVALNSVILATDIRPPLSWPVHQFP